MKPKTIIFIIIIILITIITTQNIKTIPFWLFTEFNVPLIILIGVSVILGFLLGLLYPKIRSHFTKKNTPGSPDK